MIVCITAAGESLDAACHPAFGRAPYLLFIDPETKSLDVFRNTAPAHGAGIQAAQTVADHGATALITGNVGPNAFQALKAVGIAAYVGAAGTVADALAAYQNGSLRTADAPTNPGHSGGRMRP